MIQRQNADGTVTRGAVSAGGMVIWWHPERAQIGQGVPDGVLDALDNFEKKERSPFQAYLAAGLVSELRTAMLASAPPAPQQKPLTDEQIVDAYCKERGMRQYVEAYVAGARFAEAAHGIGEKK